MSSKQTKTTCPYQRIIKLALGFPLEISGRKFATKTGERKQKSINQLINTRKKIRVFTRRHLRGFASFLLDFNTNGPMHASGQLPMKLKITDEICFGLSILLCMYVVWCRWSAIKDVVTVLLGKLIAIGSILHDGMLVLMALVTHLNDNHLLIKKLTLVLTA